MQEKPTFVKIAELTLDQAKKPLTPVEIWEQSEGVRKSLAFSTQGKTPWRSIGAQIYVDIRDNPNSVFYQKGSRPVRFNLKEYKESVSEPIEEETATLPQFESFNERDLHPLLVRFLSGNEHFHARSLTIFHEASSRRSKGFNEWLHPDLVAVHYPFDDFRKEVLNIQKQLGLSSLRLFSFEIKKSLNLSNLRESFFQAVSNSSWANEGYLVALRVETDSSLRDELRRLNNAFGIGVIELDPQAIDQTEILFPSNFNSQLDWSTINRLHEDNQNFRNLLDIVNDSLQIHKVAGNYDEVLDDRKLENYVKTKHITNT